MGRVTRTADAFTRAALAYGKLFEFAALAYGKPLRIIIKAWGLTTGPKNPKTPSNIFF